MQRNDELYEVAGNCGDINLRLWELIRKLNYFVCFVVNNKKYYGSITSNRNYRLITKMNIE